MKNKESKIIVALDTDDLLMAKKLVKELSPEVIFFKIGLEFINTGQAPELIKLIKKLGGKVFYDIKLNDIPNTVGKTVRVISKLGIDMFTVHTSAGRESLRAAVKNKGKSKVIGVTVLTSLKNDESKYIFGSGSKDKVLQFASMLAEERADGVVCSAKEVELIKKSEKLKKLKIIVPGIRPSWTKANDQIRVVEPAEALKAGADYLVIGRPITEPTKEIGSPLRALSYIIKDIL